MVESESRKKLVEYLKKNLKKGYNSDTLKYALVSQGYSRAMVEMALVQANKELAVKAPILKTKPVIKHEIIDEHDNPIIVKRPWWKRFFSE